MSTSTSAERQWFAVWSPAVAAAGAGSIATVAGAILYARFFRRIPTAEAIRPSMIARKAWIKGLVTRHVGYFEHSRMSPIFTGSYSVGDADNFRLYHTPGLFWRFPLGFRRVPASTKRGYEGAIVLVLTVPLITSAPRAPKSNDSCSSSRG